MYYLLSPYKIYPLAWFINCLCTIPLRLNVIHGSPKENKKEDLLRVSLYYVITPTLLRHCTVCHDRPPPQSTMSAVSLFFSDGLLLMVFWNTLAFPVRNFKLLLKLSELCIIRLIDVFLLHCIWLKCPYENLKLLGNFKHVIPGTSITNRACRKKVLCCLCHLNSGGQAHCKMPCHTLKEPRISKVSAISHPWKLTMFPTTKSFRRLPASFRLILLASLSMVVYHLITSKETTFIPYTNGENS